MVRHIQILILALCTPLLLLACGPSAQEPQPPQIRYGADLCAHCNMIISDPRFAAGYVRETGPQVYESLTFDDIGGMLEHAHDEHRDDSTIVAWYVHDYQSQTWLDATRAYFVVSRQLRSPMAYGIAAHASRTAADAMAQEMAGEVLDWQGLQQRSLLPMHAHHE